MQVKLKNKAQNSVLVAAMQKYIHTHCICTSVLGRGHEKQMTWLPTGTWELDGRGTEVRVASPPLYFLFKNVYILIQMI